MADVGPGVARPRPRSSTAARASCSQPSSSRKLTNPGPASSTATTWRADPAPAPPRATWPGPGDWCPPAWRSPGRRWSTSRRAHGGPGAPGGRRPGRRPGPGPSGPRWPRRRPRHRPGGHGSAGSRRGAAVCGRGRGCGHRGPRIRGPGRGHGRGQVSTRPPDGTRVASSADGRRPQQPAPDPVCPCSSADRASASGAESAGSSPARGTRIFAMVLSAHGHPAQDTVVSPATARHGGARSLRRRAGQRGRSTSRVPSHHWTGPPGLSGLPYQPGGSDTGPIGPGSSSPGGIGPTRTGARRSRRRRSTSGCPTDGGAGTGGGATGSGPAAGSGAGTADGAGVGTEGAAGATGGAAAGTSSVAAGAGADRGDEAVPRPAPERRPYAATGGLPALSDGQHERARATGRLRARSARHRHGRRPSTRRSRGPSPGCG